MYGPEDLAKLREFYYTGSRVKLESTEYASEIKPGETGTAVNLDDLGNILVNWDNGKTGLVIFGEDIVTRI